jgi:hypothetical protein
MEAGKGKSSDFRLSETLAYPVARKEFPGKATTTFFSIQDFTFSTGQPAYPVKRPYLSFRGLSSELDLAVGERGGFRGRP